MQHHVLPVFDQTIKLRPFSRQNVRAKKPLSDSIPKGLQVTLLYRCFSRIFNCTDGTKSHKASHIR